MLIRLSRSQDAEGVKAVLMATFQSTWRPNISDEAAAKFLSENRPDRFWQARGDRFWVCELEGQVAGFVDWDADFINALHVLPVHSRSGIGSRLLEVAEVAIRNAGHGQARLETDTFNATSRAFYARHGYLEMDQYPDEEWGSDLTTILMEKAFSVPS